MGTRGVGKEPCIRCISPHVLYLAPVVATTAAAPTTAPAVVTTAAGTTAAAETTAVPG